MAIRWSCAAARTTRATGEIGLFRILGKSANCSGCPAYRSRGRSHAYDVMKLDREMIKTAAGKINSTHHELDKKIESLLAHQKALEKEVRSRCNATRQTPPANARLVQNVNGIPLITHNLGDANGDSCRRLPIHSKAVSKAWSCSARFGKRRDAHRHCFSRLTSKVQAGKIIRPSRRWSAAKAAASRTTRRRRQGREQAGRRAGESEDAPGLIAADVRRL